MKRIKLVAIFLFGTVAAYSQADQPIPMVTFPEITVNISFPQYRALNSDGGAIAIEGGVRGIILYRENENTFLAYERDCPYMPIEACADVEVDISKIFLIDRCCGSTFNLSDGNPLKGPATWPLRQYKVRVNGKVLTITDEVVN